jgi:hypothetical protein
MMTHRRNVKNKRVHVNGPKKEHDRNHGNEPTGEWHRNTEDSAQVIRMIMLLECYWIATGVLLGCYWNATGMLLGCYWGATGMLLGCYWDARRPIPKSDKKEHAVVDTPGIQHTGCSSPAVQLQQEGEHAVVDTPGKQVEAALRCNCNKKEHAVVDTPGMQVIAALRSSCSEKQKGHAVVETDHTKADIPSKQIRAGVGDPTQSKEPDVEEDPPGDSDDLRGWRRRYRPQSPPRYQLESLAKDRRCHYRLMTRIPSCKRARAMATRRAQTKAGLCRDPQPRRLPHARRTRPQSPH